MEQRLFSKDFILVVIGQIISLFGNATIRFALPLYLLNNTGSSALFGMVTACAFIPAILLSPIGGIVADKVNKRNIMVILDFITSIVIIIFFILFTKVNLILLVTITLMILFGIAGAYQPSVQASVPALVSPEQFMAANSIINTISAFSSLVGPVLGGILYSTYGLKPVLLLCIICFLASAIMELFIKIPFIKQDRDIKMWESIKQDFTESIHFIRRKKPVIGKGLIIVCGVNLFLSSMIIVGLPYMVTEVLAFDTALANTLYSLAQGALATGGLVGGIISGIYAKKLTIKKSGNLILICSICVFPMGMVLMFSQSELIAYMVMTACCFLIMIVSTIFTVEMMSFVQTETPQNLIGKVISVILTVSMCTQPIGNTLYGILFEVFKGYEFAVILFAGVSSLGIGIRAKEVFQK